jgi:7-keto-8-aminopelargonate synthetase-like enzyme
MAIGTVRYGAVRYDTVRQGEYRVRLEIEVQHSTAGLTHLRLEGL